MLQGALLGYSEVRLEVSRHSRLELEARLNSCCLEISQIYEDSIRGIRGQLFSVALCLCGQ